MRDRVPTALEDHQHLTPRIKIRAAPRKQTLALVLLIACIAFFPGALSAEPTFEPNVDYPKFDYRNFELTRPRPRLCQAACNNDSRCLVWTFVRPGVLGQLASCWLKEDITEPRSNKCCISGVK